MKPWEPQGKESSVAYQAFAEYRDLGPDRSLDQVGRKLGKSQALMERWSSKYDWVKRAREFDTHIDSIRVAAREQSVAKQARKIMTADEVRAELTDIAEAPWRDFVQVKTGKDGETIGADLRLTDKIRSLELMGKTHKLFVDKLETEDKTPLSASTLEALKSLAKQLSGRDLTDAEASKLMSDSLARGGVTENPSGSVS